MRFLAVVAAAASQALRPPPSLDQAIVDALPFKADFGISKRVIELPCHECRVGPSKSVRELPLDHYPRPGETFPASVLRVNISIERDGSIEKLMLNGCQFYPRPGGCTIIWTDQFVKSPCNTWEYAASPEGGYRLRWNHVDDNVAGQGIKLQVLHLWIVRLGSKLLIGDEPEIEVKMLILPTGQLLIATDPALAPTNPRRSGPNCIKHHNSPDHHHHRHRHHHHHWFSRCTGLLIALVLHVLIPVIGGLIVAAAAFYIWRKRFLRRHRSAYSSITPEVDSKDEDKIQGYVDYPDAPLLDEGTLLLGEVAPPYEEVAVTKKEEIL